MTYECDPAHLGDFGGTQDDFDREVEGLVDSGLFSYADARARVSGVTDEMLHARPGTPAGEMTAVQLAQATVRAALMRTALRSA